MSHILIDKLLFKQYGAIKPDWISKDEFYKTPFNYCDRWCERCKLSGICRVAQTIKEQNARYKVEGIDPDSSEAIFKSIHESFLLVRKMLEKDMRKLGITRKDIEKAGEERDRIEREIPKEGIYLASVKISKGLTLLYEDIHYALADAPDILERHSEELKVMVYYMHFFTAKIYRALSNRIEEGESDDETHDTKTSIFLAKIAIMKEISVLRKLSQSDKFTEKVRNNTSRIMTSLISLLEVLKIRFG